MDEELLGFTRQALANGIEREDIARALQRAGWRETDIAASLGMFADVAFALPVPRPKPYLSAREVFLYLVMFAALYTCAWNLGSLAFALVDRAFPDPLVHVWNSDGSIRWDLSSLIVAFPVFLYTFRLISNTIRQDPTKRGSRPRKWLTYMTLFVATVTLTCDLIYLIYNALGGELTVRFVLKVGVVGIIAGGIFTYFLTDMRKEERS